MRKKNSNWYYCNTCEKPMRQKEEDGLCIDCHLYLCLCLEPDKCSRCSEMTEFYDIVRYEIDKIIEKRK